MGVKVYGSKKPFVTFNSKVYEMDNYTTFTYKCLISLMVMQI